MSVINHDELTRIDSGVPLLAGALAAARAGLEVYPCKPRTKRPAIKGNTNATSDLEQVRAWWRANPNHNIGVLIPSDVVIFDLDVRNFNPHGVACPGLMDMFWHLKDVVGDLPETFEVHSGRGDGGVHLWFKCKGIDTWSIPQHASALGNGFDVLTRSKGGGWGVMFPPSLHPQTRLPYKLVPHPIAELPERAALILKQAALDKDYRPASASGGQHGARRAVASGHIDIEAMSPRRRARANHALIAWYQDNAKPGQRNNLLFKVACTLSERNVTEDELSELERVAISKGLTLTEVRCTIASARKRVAGGGS